MAFDAFIKLRSIEGESRDDGHKGWIEVLKYGLGQRQRISTAPSSCGGACAGKADFLNQRDPTIWTVLNTVARNFGLDPCKTTIDECDREDLDFLCDKIHREEWVLIIRKYHGIKSVKLEQCCIELTQKINRAITNSAITSAILIALPFFQAFFYPYPEKVASMASAAMGIGTEDWKQLAEAIKGVNLITRESVSNDAGKHSLARHKDRKLQQLWREISDAFA